MDEKDNGVAEIELTTINIIESKQEPQDIQLFIDELLELCRNLEEDHIVNLGGNDIS